MKRNLLLVLALTIIFSGCASSKKQLEKGNYDASVAAAVKQLRKKPDDAKQAAVLEHSFNLANDLDNKRIEYLKMEGKPQSWDEIYQTYRKMSDRQTLVSTVMPLNEGGKTITFPYVDYMKDMIEAKQKAADYYYAHGNDLMKSGMKDSYRQAYSEFLKAKDYAGNYEGIDSKIQNARYLGISRVFVSLHNSTMLKFTRDFETDLLNLNLQALNSDWVEYYTADLDTSIHFDYFININIKNIAVSPDQTTTQDSVIKKTVQDGFKYQLDNKGNVMRDSLGNDIKIKKYKNLQCALIYTMQNKICQMDGDIEYIQINPNKLLKDDPIGARSDFRNISARGVGDSGALNDRQLASTKTQVIPFPTDMDMVMRCSGSLKNAIRGSIQNNRSLIY
ncbi:MAG: hypothetical protein ABSG89_06070 [Bacteroidales bacterium]|jgi:uncharacterized protein YceK